MSLIQKLKVDHLIFGEIAEMALSRVLREGDGIWKNSLHNNEVPSPVGKGWFLERLETDWMNGFPAPRAVIELNACTCKKSCDGTTCDCILNGLKCLDLSRRTTCSNQ
ncbi:unnamed protein product [Porites lobata]|uniref:Uncharacterized protein n=1 Tax=Porites lobata TaxID=104759 RepID=A0ABN8MRA9_9CNID|nr:unnamed protein product [Porites lobata]